LAAQAFEISEVYPNFWMADFDLNTPDPLPEQESWRSQSEQPKKVRLTPDRFVTS
jgi:hypothetical protein